MKKKLFKYFVELTGNSTSSALLKSFTSSRLSQPMIRPFSKTYQINTDEMAHPIAHYKSLQSFFTRQLKDDVREINASPTTLTSPVDGVVSGVGQVNQQQTFHIKNRPYSIDKIFGDEKKAAPYREGFFFLLYLSPSHYHHFHYPISGEIISRYALGGISYPVNDLGLKFGGNLFSTNHRIISEMQTSFGKVAVIAVGALNVNSIQLSSSSKTCVKGEAFGHFSFGSTVIIFIENTNSFTPTIPINSEVFMGQSIGEWIQKKKNRLIK